MEPEAGRQIAHGLQQEAGFLEGDENNVPKTAPRTATWITTTPLIVADVVGVGVLSLPAAFAQLGWASGLPLLVCCWPLNFFTGFLLNRVHLAFPSFGTFGDAAAQLAGDIGSVVGYGSLYLYLLMLLGNYFLVLSSAFQGIFWQWELCRPQAGLFCALLLLPSSQLRTLGGLSGLSVVSFSCMVSVCCLCVFAIGNKSSSTCSAAVLPEAASVLAISQVLSKFVFGFSGHKIFLEMQAEMKQPEHFPRAMNVAYPLLIVAYGALCSSVFSMCGDSTPGFLLDVLDYDWLRSLTNVLLFVPITVSYSISQQVLARAIAKRALPLALGSGMPARVAWFGLTISLMVFGWVLSNSIPLFADFVSLMGALLSTQMTFSLPCLLYLGVRRIGALPAMPKVVDQALLFAVFVVLLISIALTILGTWAAVRSIVQDAAGVAPPFGCLCIAETCLQ